MMLPSSVSKPSDAANARTAPGTSDRLEIVYVVKAIALLQGQCPVFVTHGPLHVLNHQMIDATDGADVLRSVSNAGDLEDPLQTAVGDGAGSDGVAESHEGRGQQRHLAVQPGSNTCPDTVVSERAVPKLGEAVCRAI